MCSWVYDVRTKLANKTSLWHIGTHRTTKRCMSCDNNGKQCTLTNENGNISSTKLIFVTSNFDDNVCLLLSSIWMGAMSLCHSFPHKVTQTKIHPTFIYGYRMRANRQQRRMPCEFAFGAIEVNVDLCVCIYSIRLWIYDAIWWCAHWTK